jgi:hypothetical protein
LTAGSEDGQIDPFKYVTPRKPPLLAQREGSPSDESWEGLSNHMSLPGTPTFVGIDLTLINSPSSAAGKDINSRRALQALQENFATLREHLSATSDRLSSNFEDVTTRLNRLAISGSSMDRRIGEANEFGADGAVTSAFDGLRFMHEQLDSSMEPFLKVPYAGLVAKFGKLETDFSVFTSTFSHDALESLKHDVMEKVTTNQDKTVKNFEALKDKFIRPMSQFYAVAMKRGGTIFDRLETLEDSAKGNSEDGNLFGAVSFMGGLTQIGEFGSPRHVTEFEKRMGDLEQANLALRTELETLKENQTSPLGGQLDGTSQDPRVDGLLTRLGLLEVQDGESIEIGTYKFTNVVDCEVFLLAKVPGPVLSAFCYDMVSLVHRVPKNGEALSPEAILSRDYTAHKGGFTHVGSAYIYSSMQQALPGPLGGTATHPLPGVKLFKEWDGEDGVSGKRAEITKSMDNTVRALLAMLVREFRGHPEALSVFQMMILQGQIHWQAYANFLAYTRNSCFRQCEDEKEAWLYPSEVGKGVLEEALKVRTVGGERSTTDKHTIQDAARMMWGALRCYKLMETFVLCDFEGHPQLAGYSIGHLFRNRVTMKHLDGLKTKITAIKTDLSATQGLAQKLKAKHGI